MVQNKIGRPRQFDTDAALAAATEVFWLKGYDATSLDDLTSAMGINRPSLYAAFKDKQSLYLSALENYASTYGLAAMLAFKAEVEPEAALTAFLTTIVKNQARGGTLAKGCLLVSCASSSAGQVAGVQDFLANVTQQTIAGLESGFEAFKANGKLPKDFPSNAKASLAVDVTHGFAFRARVGEPLQELFESVDEKVAQILGAYGTLLKRLN